MDESADGAALSFFISNFYSAITIAKKEGLVEKKLVIRNSIRVYVPTKEVAEPESPATSLSLLFAGCARQPGFYLHLPRRPALKMLSISVEFSMRLYRLSSSRLPMK